MIEQLFVQNVRGLRETNCPLSPAINVWVGENGAGKTSVLEAISLLSTGRSFVTPRVKSLIQFEEAALTVFARTQQAGNSHRLALQISSQGERRIRVDGGSATAQSALSRLLPAVFIVPQMTDLVNGAPGDRRRFLDWGAFHCMGGRASVFAELRRALLQRNTGLRSGTLTDVDLDGWDFQIAALGEQVHQWRREFVSDLLGCVEKKLAAFNLAIDLSFQYDKGWAQGALSDALFESRARDRRSRQTQVGPQRADLVVARDGVRASDVLSRGQCKAVHIALMLGQLEVAQAAGMSPILCLDDPGAELDGSFQDAIWETVRSLGCQVLATGIDLARVGMPDEFIECSRVFHVKHGEIALVKEA